MGETRAGREQKAEAEGLAGGGVSMKKGTPRRLPGKGDICASQDCTWEKLETQSISRWPN